MEEIWENINIEDYDKYKISNFGRIKNKNNKIIKQYINKSGYFCVKLYKKGKHKEYRVHRLVMITFQDNKNRNLDINHKDGNKLNNNLNNLEWCTHKYNIQHSYNNGLFKNRTKRDKQKMIIEEQTKKVNKIIRIRYNIMTSEEKFENIRNIIDMKMRKCE